jgi:hypothetical protein
MLRGRHLERGGEYLDFPNAETLQSVRLNRKLIADLETPDDLYGKKGESKAIPLTSHGGP